MADVPYLYVNTYEGLRQAVETLAGVTALGIDLEHNHLRCYQGLTCLVQLSTGPSSLETTLLSL